MERRTIFFLEKINPGRYRVVAEVPDYTSETLQPPKTQIGVSVSAEELDRCPTLGIPTLRRCLNTDQAFPSTNPEPGCQFIALLCLQDGVGRSVLHDSSLEHLLELCLTWDSGLEPAPA